MEINPEPIIVAFITGLSAIIVALINYIANLKARSRSKETEVKKSIFKKGRKISLLKRIAEPEKRWILVMCVFVPWMIISTALMPYFAAINLTIIIPAFTIILSVIWPIKPLTAVITVLALHPPNLYLGEIFLSHVSSYYHEYYYGNYSYSEYYYDYYSWASSLWWVFLLIICINTAVVGIVCQIRINAQKGKKIKITKNERTWLLIMFILIPWLIFSPLLWELHLFNLIITIPVITLILSIFISINPYKAWATVLALHFLNLFLGINKSRIPDPNFQTYLILLPMIVNSVLAGIICYRQIKKK